jgi:CRISPR-associated protein Cas6
MTTVDLAFPLLGGRVARDHGYALYGAICRVAPGLHAAAWLGVHPLGGKPDDGTLALGARAQLRLRLPASHIADVLALAGARLDVDGAGLVVGAPRVHALVPAAALDARMVAIKLTLAPRRAHAERGEEAARCDWDQQGVRATRTAEPQSRRPARGRLLRPRDGSLCG